MSDEQTTAAERLRATLDRASAEVASWPRWQRDFYKRALASLHGHPDPCHRPDACDEAQTCVGGCVYGTDKRGTGAGLGVATGRSLSPNRAA